MSFTAILLPVLVQMGLTFILGLRLAIVRRGAALRGDVRLADIALGQKAWPGRIQQLGNAYDNQFQLPVVLYVLVAFSMITGTADLAFVVLEWVFVGSRIAHAYVHTTSNHVPTRFRLFVFGVLVLLAMWVIFAARLLLGAA